ncbi:MAG: sensor domain-containing diguanylate cyclase [Alphaproteobacteria bacterium]|nr:MAG: sensor domain-containing diguanylate cyclase [Alphaproteobacteria bacterium]
MTAPQAASGCAFAMSPGLRADLVMKALDATSYAVMITDAQATILAVNPAFSRVTGWSTEEVIGRTPRILSSGRQDADFYEEMWHALHETGHWHGELWNRRKSGDIYPEHLVIDAVRDSGGEIEFFVAVFSDIAERKERERRLSYLAYHDEITDLPNRALFMDRLSHGLALARRRGTPLAVVLLDLDGFKDVNDTFGHEAGDLLLRSVAQRMKSGLRDSDTLARLGGDEFAILLPAVGSARDARKVVMRVQAALRRPFYLAGDEVCIGGSAGGALYPANGADAEELLRCADLAMYEVKRRGKGDMLLYGDIAPRRAAQRARAG